MKIRDKILTYFLIIFFVPTFVLAFVLLRNSQINLEDQIIGKLQSIAQIQKNRVESVLSEKQDLLSIFTSRTLLKNQIEAYLKKPTPELQAVINTSLAEADSGTARFDGIMIADINGNIIASSRPGFLNTNILGDEIFTKGIKKNDVLIFKKDPNTGVIDEYLAGPLVANKELLGVAVLHVDSSDLLDISNDYTGLGKTGETLLVKNDGNGNALFLTPSRFDKKAALSRVVLKSSPNVVALQVINGKETTYLDKVDYRGVPVFAVTRYIPSVEWAVVVKIDKDEANIPLKNIMLTTTVVLVFGTLLSVFVAWFFSNSFSNPIKELTSLTKKLADGTLTQSIIVSSHDEVGELAGSFNSMAKSLKEARSNIEEKVRIQTEDILAKEKLLEEQTGNLERSVKISSDLVKDLSKFKLAVDNVSDMIVITDPNGVMIYCNKMVKAITGYEQKDAIGKKAATLWKFPMPKEIYEEMWRTIKIEKKPYKGEIKNKRKNGVVYDVDVLISPVLDDNNEILFFVGIERDVTREKEIDRAKTEFVSLSSHQLRTPLSSINWNTEMLINGDAGEVNEKQMRFLREIYSSSQRMIALINAFLEVSRIEIGTFSGKPKMVNINEAAGEILKELHPMVEKRKQILSESYDPNIPEIFTDVKMIQAIFQNLTSNAIKYTKEGGEVQVKTILSSDKKDALIEVSDNGIGISEDQKHQIFERFFRTEAAREIDTDGTGLGLYLLKLITEKVGGEISFTSEAGKGTTFFVRLPIEKLTSKEEEESVTQK